MELIDVFCGLYAFLTAMKIAQLAMGVVDMMKKAPNTRQMGYSPSLQLIINLVDYAVVRDSESINKIPRKIFRNITDPWVQAYTKRVNSEDKSQRRVFTKLGDALNTFYLEFCQETSSFMVHWIANSSSAFIMQPLGLHSIIGILYWVTLAPFMLAREILLGGNALTFNCKMAASATMNEVYVVSCKEQISLEEALQKYPWFSGVFSQKQVHAMIGRAACPLYKRELPFPAKQHVMDFDYVVIESGLAKLKQHHDSILGNILESCYASHVVLIGALLYFCFQDYLKGNVFSFSWLATVAPYAASFYPVRMLVDWSLGIKWHPSLYFFV